MSALETSVVGWEQQPGNSIILCTICISGFFYNVAMTEMVTLLDPTVALALPNEDSGSANGRISCTYLVC